MARSTFVHPGGIPTPGCTCYDCVVAGNPAPPRQARPKAIKVRAAGSERSSRYKTLVKRDGERCAICDATDRLTIDHIKPLSRGGGNSTPNLRLLCYYCNQAKADLEISDEEVLERRKRYPKGRRAKSGANWPHLAESLLGISSES